MTKSVRLDISYESLRECVIQLVYSGGTTTVEARRVLTRNGWRTVEDVPLGQRIAFLNNLIQERNHESYT